MGDCVCEAEFVVPDGKGEPLLGWRTATAIRVFQKGGPINSVSSDTVEEYTDYFVRGELHVKEYVALLV